MVMKTGSMEVGEYNIKKSKHFNENERLRDPTFAKKYLDLYEGTILKKLYDSPIRNILVMIGIPKTARRYNRAEVTIQGKNWSDRMSAARPKKELSSKL